MTYTDVRALELGDKLNVVHTGHTTTVAQITDNYVRLEWYGGRPHDILNKLSPLWAGLERVQ